MDGTLSTTHAEGSWRAVQAAHEGLDRRDENRSLNLVALGLHDTNGRRLEPLAKPFARLLDQLVSVRQKEHARGRVTRA